MQLQEWLNLLCTMIPGVSQAIVLTDGSPAQDNNVVWPGNADIDEAIISAARLAAGQQKAVSTVVSPAQNNDSIENMIIALPVRGSAEFQATLAVAVSVKPSQQAVVMQLLQWGESWLQLLLAQQKHPVAMLDADRPQSQAEKTGGFSRIFSGRARYVLPLLIFLAIGLSLVTGTYRVAAPASLEGRIQRVIVAPYEAYIANAYVRAGETVARGDIIAELETRELNLELQRLEAEKNEYTRQYRQALASREVAQAHIYKSQISQAEAQLELLQKKIQKSSLAAPIDGVVIAGDLSRSLGAPVKTGDVLFEVAPLDEYRLVIQIDEKQVIDVEAGMQGILTLKALPSARLGFKVHKVSPVFEENVKGIAYRVEATLDEQHPALRPGMQGIAKIDIEPRSYLWIYFHELFDAIRLWLWTWQP